MSTLEDKILGEKNHYYCDSSDSDGEEQSDSKRRNESTSASVSRTVREGNSSERVLSEWEGYSVNTGPKGVLNDWQRFKQIENERRIERENERLKLIEKLSLNCSSHLDDEKAKAKEEQLDNEFENLLLESDSYLKEYMKKRMEEMIVKKQCEHKYGQLEIINCGNDFLNIIEKTDKEFTVICHIFNSRLPGCQTMNGCLKCLAEQYPYTRFIAIEASAAGMSKHFEKSGVPALLAYKSGNLIGNFVCLTNEFGDDFFANDVEEFLVDHGLLPDSTLIPEIMKKGQTS